MVTGGEDPIIATRDPETMRTGAGTSTGIQRTRTHHNFAALFALRLAGELAFRITDPATTHRQRCHLRFTVIAIKPPSQTDTMRQGLP